ncbi:MAG TPA: aldehyde dehydrogenase family protein [Oligoflexia bacterium]|nr:aldehyde dehydrogenase family protein [Oligoflexia bacterium]HMP26576.1 aldehyde dehydrogenase family protein [Oligoflexia bacterium]
MRDILKQLGIKELNNGAWGLAEYGVKPNNDTKSIEIITSFSPIDNQPLAKVTCANEVDYQKVVSDAHGEFVKWRILPAPKRGEIVREIADAVRAKKRELGRLISLEVGKILSEGEGEVQEVIDIADFAVGLSRQLYGLQMHSERPNHRMLEQWHPLGVVGVITAFNFPMAVWAWNAMIAAVCGDTIVWKPSELAPLSAIAINNIAREVAQRKGFSGVFSLLIGKADLGARMAADRNFDLISATGSTRMGKAVGTIVAERFGKSLLELGGNNAIIVTQSANLELAARAILFSAAGTAGQRCTTARRLIVNAKISKELLRKLIDYYNKIKIGDPLEEGVLMGPLINQTAVEAYLKAVTRALADGGELLCGGSKESGLRSDLYVKPTIIKMPKMTEVVKEETFAPILYVLEYETLEEAIEIHNGVTQGLSSAIFTDDLREAGIFISVAGSDCGIANVNIGTSGAEIGGAFGGEKETGGGREAGSDAWKSYMRRQTCTINFGRELPLAQGVKFDI